ncbi:MAG: winged helix-turn-helix transcriptional regulator [Zetaproteobacteria bacterium]|nr:winged helix-turn-helix transcriptional regulator [Zetaproteobacteria bacterium]
MQNIPVENIKEAADGLRAIAHELRLSVLCHLMEGPMCVRELMEATGSPQSNLSQHLAKMRMMGLLEREKRGQEVYYQVTNPAYCELIASLKKIYCSDECQ